MKLKDWLTGAEKQLRAEKVPTAQLDSLVLLEDELQRERSWLLANPELDISLTHQARLNKKVVRRAQHEPLAYIRGFSEFYGRRFKVNKRVLEPRPESETMIDMLKELKPPKSAVIADVGTGSGALGITAALELHNHNVDLYDIDSGALAVAKHNTVWHELHLHVRKSNLLSQHLRDYSVILANLPYVPRSWQINRAAQHEPRLAIDGGSDGLDVYRRLFGQLQRLKSSPKYVLTEALPPQQVELAGIAKSSGYKLLKGRDFIQLFQKN